VEFLIIGIVSALNLIVIVHKFRKGRVEDGIFDSVLFALMAMIFSGSYGGMVVAMISSLIISIYLWTSPPKFFKSAISSDEGKAALAEAKNFLFSAEPLKSSTSKKSAEELRFD
jgi:hypothetical protein